MNAQQMVRRLTEIEVAQEYASEPDLRQVLREERFALTAALQSGDGRKIADAMQEARRVADMWDVTL